MFTLVLVGLMEIARASTLVADNHLDILNLLTELLMIVDRATGKQPFIQLVSSLTLCNLQFGHHLCNVCVCACVYCMCVGPSA